MVLADMAIVVSSLGIAYLARFEGSVPEVFGRYITTFMLAGMIVVPSVFWIMRLYGYVWRQVGVDMVLRLAGAVALIGGTAIGVDLAVSVGRTRYIPIGVIIIASVVLFVGAAALRSGPRMAHYLRTQGGVTGGRKVLLVGAGNAGSLLLRDIEARPDLQLNVVGFVDDDPVKRGKLLRSARVLGSVSDIPALVANMAIEEVLVAMPSATPVDRARVLEVCASVGVKSRILPSIADQAARSSGISDLRNVRVEDLIGREIAPLAAESIGCTISGQRVVVTGAAGSIGSELCRQLLPLGPAGLILLDIDESRLYELYLELIEDFPGVPEMRICDIRDDRKLVEILSEFGTTIVLHAAAYKHVPLMEIEPDEAVKTNVVGTRNVLDACAAAGVERFVLISTDKAVAPTSVMGMTKAIAERMTMDACRSGLRSCIVRFGNVLGSRGSVLPLFEEQLRRGSCLKVTHPDVTRYFMTIPEAARLVLQAQAMSDGGDIFVLDMGQPVRIVDLANKMIALSGAEVRVEFTELRPAEKLHEVLVNPGESLIPTSAERIDQLSAVTLPPTELAALVHALASAARMNDRELMRSLIRRLLPDTAAPAESGWSGSALDDGITVSVIDPDMETVF